MKYMLYWLRIMSTIYHAGVVLKWSNHVLVGLRKHKKINRQNWQFPQGRIETGEKPLCAAKRELFEETSINPDSVEWCDKETSWLSYQSVYNQHKIKFFYAQASTKPDVNICYEEFIKYKWVKVDDVLKLFQGSFKCQVLDEAVSIL